MKNKKSSSVKTQKIKQESLIEEIIPSQKKTYNISMIIFYIMLSVLAAGLILIGIYIITSYKNMVIIQNELIKITAGVGLIIGGVLLAMYSGHKLRKIYLR